MASKKRVVFVGIPGVGKTTVISEVLRVLKAKNIDAQHVVFGTLMFNEAVRVGVKNRDEIRKLPVEQQRTLQIQAAKSILAIQCDTLLVDTHLFIVTSEGYWPGLPRDILENISPTNLVLIEATPEEIRKRRMNDKTRYREDVTRHDIEKDLSLARNLVSAASMITGAPFIILNNEEGRSYEAAERALRALGVI